MKFSREHYELMLKSLKEPLTEVPEHLMNFFHVIEEKRVVKEKVLEEEKPTLFERIVQFFKRLIGIEVKPRYVEREVEREVIERKYVAKVNRFVLSKDLWSTYGISKKEGTLVIMELRVTVYTFSDEEQILSVYESECEKRLNKVFDYIESKGMYYNIHQVGKPSYEFREVDLLDYQEIQEIDTWFIDVIDHENKRKWSFKFKWEMVEK